MKFDIDVPSEDIEYAANARDSAMHPSEFEYGMGEDSMLPEDIMLNDGSTGGFETMPGGFDSMSGGFDNMSGSMGVPGGFGTMPGGTGMFGKVSGSNTNAAQDERDFDEKLFAALGTLFKGGWTLLKECVKAFSTLQTTDFMSLYKRNTITGIVFIVIGVILLICGLHVCWGFIFGGAITSVGSFGAFAVLNKKLQKQGNNANSVGMTNAVMNAGYTDGVDGTETMEEFSDDDTDMFTFEDEEFEDTQDFEDVQDFNTIEAMEDAETMSFNEEVEDSFTPIVFDTDDIDDTDDFGVTATQSNTFGGRNLPEITNGMVTRQYLFEKFTQAIENSTPQFAEYTVLSENSDEFKQWNAVVATALSVLAPANAPDVFLLSVKKKIFCYVLEIQRATWMKNKNAIVDEIVNTVSYDKKTNKRDPRIYGTGEFAAKSLYVKIVTSDTALVTVKDILTAEKEFFLDTKRIMPVTLGISIDGTPVLDDLRYVDNMMVSGMPRAGKSWFIKSLIGQLMFFNTPDDINFYFLDPKDFASDFASVQTPHVKKFIADDTAIINLLRDIVHTEGSRRSALLRENDAQNIWDFKAKHPDKDLPIIYIVIDEVVTLACRMDKETSQEFQSLLLECISRLAYVGIRLILIPHLVKHNILNKSITDMITWRACVGGTIEQVASVTGDKKFKTKLSSVGDSAVLHNSEVEFVHSCSIATTNDRYCDVFEYIAAFWSKVDSRYITDVEVVHSNTAFVRATDTQLESYGTETSSGQTTKTNSKLMKKATKPAKTVEQIEEQQDTVYNVDTDTDVLDIW